MVHKLLFIGLLAVSVIAGSRWDEEGRQWWRNVAYLASNDMQGRNVGTRGFELAANYVAEQYERIGLKAAGGDGYFQNVAFSEAALTWAAIRLERAGRVDPASIPSEVLVHFDANSPAEIRAPIVFAGYGLKIPEVDYDDLKGLPIKGAIVAYFSGYPDGVPSNLKAHYSTSEVRWQAMREAGAVGMIAIPNPKFMEMPWIREAATIASPRMALADPLTEQFKDLEFNATWNPAQADDLLTGSGHTFAEVLEADARRNPLPHFPIGCTLTSKMTVTKSMVSSKNVVASHRGSDQDLRDEYVVVSAHLDHLGVGKAEHGDSVYHGAMDDASGVSSLIEIAKMLRNVSTKRSILFVAMTGEEKGELGSEYFTRNPPVRGKMVADLNMDMFLPLVPLRYLAVQGLDESTLGEDIRAIAGQAGVMVQTDSAMNENQFVRSDQYSFAKAGVPALAFKFGYKKGDPDERVFQEWYAKRYHAVKDNIEQPVDLESAARFNEMLKALLVRVANADEPPQWRQNSLYRRFAASSSGM